MAPVVALGMMLCNMGLAVLAAIFVILYDPRFETPEGSDSLVVYSAMMEKCAR